MNKLVFTFDFFQCFPLTRVSSLVSLEVGALRVNFVTPCDVASMNFASFQSVPALTIDTEISTVSCANPAVSSSSETDAAG